MKALLLVVLLLSACAGPDAKVCAPEALGVLPIRLIGNVPVTVVGINDRPAALIVDIGSDITLLSRSAAQRLGVAFDDGQAVRLNGAGGAGVASRAALPVLRLGNIVVRNVNAVVGRGLRPPIDGVLGINVLTDFDLDLDAPNGTLTLYRPRSAACAGAPLPWTGRYARLPVEQEGTGHLFVPVTLDGQPMRALLDTGASRTTVGLSAAAATGLTEAELLRGKASVTQSLDAAGIVVRPRTFRQLGIGEDLIDDPALNVADLPPQAGDLIVGSDYLGSRRMWIALGTGAVFAGAPGGVPDGPPDQPRPR